MVGRRGGLRGGGGGGNISIWGSGTRTEYRGAHYRQQPTTLCHSRGSHYLLFEETFCSKHFVILREITLDRLISTDSRCYRDLFLSSLSSRYGEFDLSVYNIYVRSK